MGERIPIWIRLWLFFSSAVCLLDALFVLLRPDSFAGGKYDSPIWQPWQHYLTIDKRYGDLTDPFVVAQSWCNVAEIILNLITLVLTFMSSAKAAPLALTVSAMTLWKTVVYLLLYVVVPPSAGAPSYHEHNDLVTNITMLWIPSGIWILLPFLVVRSLLPRLQLQALPKAQSSGKNKKKNK